MSLDQNAEVAELGELKSQRYGETITNFDQLEKAQSEATALDERFFVRLNDGRVVEIEGVENNPKEPIINGVYYKDEESDGSPLRMGMFADFLGNSPVIVDSTTVWEKK